MAVVIDSGTGYHAHAAVQNDLKRLRGLSEPTPRDQ